MADLEDEEGDFVFNCYYTVIKSEILNYTRGLKTCMNSEIIYLLFLSPQPFFSSGAHVKFSRNIVISLSWEAPVHISVADMVGL